MITVDADGTPLPAEFAAVVERGEQAVLTRLVVDFDGDGYAGVDVLRPDGFTVDRALSTELPAQVRLATGYAAAELKADLSAGDPADDSTTAAQYFTRGSSSPIGAKERIRRPVVADVGYLTESGPVLVRRFTGLTRALPTSAGRGTASLTALDLRERLRNTVVLIPTNGEESGADGTWIVLQALAANGIAAGPVPRTTGALIWLPMYGSLNTVATARDPSWLALIISEVGDSGPRPRFRAGPFVLAADDLFHHSDDDTQRVFVSRSPDSTTWDGLRGRIEFWILGVPNPTTGIPGSQGRCYAALKGNTDAPRGRSGVRHDSTLFYNTYDAVTDAIINSYSSSFVVPGDDRYHFVGIGWDFVAQRIIFRLDDREETQVTAVTPATEVANPMNFWQFTSYVSCSDVHLHGPIELTETWLSQTVDVRAYLDPSTLQLVACLEDQPREAWELITEVAAAEQAVVYFDEQGVFRYRTRRRLVDAAGQTVARTLTAVSALLDLDVDDGIDQIRNIVQVSYEPVDLPGVDDLVYTDSTRRVVAANSVLDFTASLERPAVRLQTVAFLRSILEFDAFGPGAGPYLVATLNADFSSDGAAIGAYSNVIRAEITAWTPKAATVRVINGAPAPIYITAVGLRGAAATVGNRVVAEARNEASIAAWGAQPLQIQAPQWVQSPDIAQSLASALVGDLKQPRRTIGTVTIVGDPRLQLGDRVALDYPTRPELDGEYWLTAIADTATASGDYTQQVALREATVVLRWGVGRWGQNTWG